MHFAKFGYYICVENCKLTPNKTYMENTNLSPVLEGLGKGVHVSPFENGNTMIQFPGDTPELMAMRRLTMPTPKLDVAGFTIRTGYDWLCEAQRNPAPKDLWRDYGMVYENECTCIFSDTNVGKSILAVQIGIDIARNTCQNVLYVDYELSERQFAARYTDDNGNKMDIPDNFFRAQMCDIVDSTQLEQDPVSRVMDAIMQTAADVVIIDNITWLSCQTEQSDVAGELMMRLSEMKRRGKLTIIVIAHTPKRPASQPITLNDIGGSKKIANFVDSVIAMGRSGQGEDIRYVKHLKGRNAIIRYGGDNVLLCRMTKDDGYVHLEPVGTAPERSQLRRNEPVDLEQLRQLKMQGLSLREIAERIGLSKSRIQQLLAGH